MKFFAIYTLACFLLSCWSAGSTKFVYVEGAGCFPAHEFMYVYSDECISRVNTYVALQSGKTISMHGNYVDEIMRQILDQTQQIEIPILPVSQLPNELKDVEEHE